MREEGRSPTQRLAERLKTEGHAGMQVRSLAKGTRASGLTLVLRTGRPDLPAALRVADDKGRLR